MSELTPVRRLSLLGGIAAAAILAAACTSGATQSPSTVATPPSSPSAAASESASATPAASPSASGEEESYEVKAVSDAKLGMILVGEDGKTLYQYAKDSPGKSVCNGGCATAWPPFVLEGDEKAEAGEGVTGELTTITRDDGTKQVAYKGVPLYYFASDEKAGDTTGQGVGGVWTVVKP